MSGRDLSGAGGGGGARSGGALASPQAVEATQGVEGNAGGTLAVHVHRGQDLDASPTDLVYARVQCGDLDERTKPVPAGAPGAAVENTHGFRDWDSSFSTLRPAGVIADMDGNVLLVGVYVKAANGGGNDEGGAGEAKGDMGGEGEGEAGSHTNDRKLGTVVVPLSLLQSGGAELREEWLPLVHSELGDKPDMSVLGHMPQATGQIKISLSLKRDADPADGRARVVRMYTKYNPDKLGRIDGFIAHFKDSGGAEALIKTLVEKYGPEPPNPNAGSDSAKTGLGSVTLTPPMRPLRDSVTVGPGATVRGAAVYEKKEPTSVFVKVHGAQGVISHSPSASVYVQVAAGGVHAGQKTVIMGRTKITKLDANQTAAWAGGGEDIMLELPADWGHSANVDSVVQVTLVETEEGKEGAPDHVLGSAFIPLRGLPAPVGKAQEWAARGKDTLPVVGMSRIREKYVEEDP